MEIVKEDFLIDFLDRYSDEDMILLNEAVENNFVVEMFNDEIISKDWGRSHEIYQEIVFLIYKKLFDVTDENGFPKAIAFVEKYLRDTNKTKNTNDII